MKNKFSIFHFSYSIELIKFNNFQIGKKWQMTNGKLQIRRGFSLIEVVTSIALFGIIGVIVVSLLTFTLRGGKKTDAMENMRQSGDLILSSMVRTIRYAASIDSPVCVDSVTSSELTITPLVGTKTTYSCTAISDAIAVNGASLVDTNTMIVQNCSFTCRKPAGTDTPTVTINFTLSTKDTSGLFENKVTIPFTTTVSTRNTAR